MRGCYFSAVIWAILEFTACGRKAPHATGRRPLQSTQSPGPSPIASTRSGGPLAGATPSPEEMTQKAAALFEELRSGLLANDHERVAGLLTYPVLVRTASRCDASIEDRQLFLAHFADIVPESTRRTVLSAPHVEGVLDYRGLNIGNVILHQRGDKMIVDGFCTAARRIPNLPCLGEPELPAPEWLNGRWRVAAIVQLSLLPPIDGWIDLNLAKGTAQVGIGRAKGQVCQIARFGARSSAALDLHSAAHWGLTARAPRDEFLDLECGPQKDIRRLEVLGPAIFGLFCGEYTLVLRPAIHAVRPGHRAREDESCAEAACSKGLACKAESGALDTPVCSQVKLPPTGQDTGPLDCFGWL